MPGAFVLRCLLLSVAPIVQTPSGDAAAVYRAVLADPACSGLGRHKGRDMLVIATRTDASLDTWLERRRGGLDAQIREWFPQASPDHVKAFLEANRRKRDLPGEVLEAPGIIPIDQATLEAFGQARFWDRFYTQYPAATGYIRLGSVIVDSGYQHLVAYCGISYAFLGGEGHLFLLERTASGWAVVAKRLLWES